MNRFKIEDQLNKLKGKDYLIKGDQHTFLRFQVGDAETKITTDKKDFSVKNSETQDFINNMMEVESHALIRTSDYAPPVPKQHVELSGILMDNIRRLQESPDFIPQANAINEQAKSMIDLCKAEIELAKVNIMANKLK